MPPLLNTRRRYARSVPPHSRQSPHAYTRLNVAAAGGTEIPPPLGRTEGVTRTLPAIVVTAASQA